MRFEFVTAGRIKMPVFWDVGQCSLVIYRVSELLAASINKALMIEVVCTPETSDSRLLVKFDTLSELIPTTFDLQTHP